MNVKTSKQLRVAVVGPYPLNPGKVAGGIQAVVKNLVLGLTHFQDLEIHVVTVDFDGKEELVPQSGVEVHALRSKQGISQFAFYRQERQWLIRTLQEIRPDVVHVHGTNFYGCAAADWDFPTVFTIHGILQREGKLDYTDVGTFHQLYRRVKGYFNSSFEVKTLKHARHIIAISPYVTEFLKEFKFDQVYFINNPVEEAYFELEDRTQPKRIFFAGLIHARKGVLHLLKAIKLVRQEYPDIELYLVGKVQESEYEAVLRSYVRDHHLEQQVNFRGFVDDEELLQAFAECQILVLPSQEETSPMVVQQAMAAGKPVIATRAGGVPYLVEDGDSGLLVPYGDPQALSKAILRLLTDPDECRRLGKQGRALSRERFRSSSICFQTREVYYELARKPKKLSA